METLYDIMKNYGANGGEKTMWKTVQIISDSVEKDMDERARKALARKIYYEVAGGHYNEQLAMEDVKCMYYIDSDGRKVNAPYWTTDQVSVIYDNMEIMDGDLNLATEEYSNNAYVQRMNFNFKVKNNFIE